jgi:N-acetylgalactosamine-6-sulfatase
MKQATGANVLAGYFEERSVLTMRSGNECGDGAGAMFALLARVWKDVHEPSARDPLFNRAADPHELHDLMTSEPQVTQSIPARFCHALAMTAALLMLGTGAHAAAGDAHRRPNIVFILGDDWGWGDLGSYGHPQLRTPNLDRLAAQGSRFTQFYQAASVCSPSRAALLTGQFPARNRIHSNLAQLDNAARGMPDYLDPHVTTLADTLKKAGYATGHFGKWHLSRGDPSAPPPTEYGFDVASFQRYEPLERKDQPGARARSAAQIVDESIQFIEGHRDEPFYVQVWLLDPHARLQPTEGQLAEYPMLLGAPRIYYSAVTNADRQIGRLLQKLDDLGLAKNTIVLFSSDNGPEDIDYPLAAEHGVGSSGPFRGRKRSLYEGGIRVPFIVRWPAGTIAGKVDDTTILAGVDLPPTLSSLAGISPPADAKFDGEDLSKALRGTPMERTKPLTWEWRFDQFGRVIDKSPMLAIRSKEWKLLMNPDRSRVELYDIPADPSELNNLADRRPEIVKRLAERLLAWRATLPSGPRFPTAGSNSYPFPR